MSDLGSLLTGLDEGERVQAHLNDAEPRRTIVVADTLVNIVV